MRILPRSLRRFVSAALVCCVFLSTVCRAAEKNSSYLAALESIRVADLKRHVDYLANDKLAGREAGRRGGRAAGEYLKEQLRKLDLRGGGVQGGFFQPFPPNYRNVLALLPGSDPKRKDQIVVLSAHYDHVGYGTRSNSRGPVGYIHNGADDNASGTSALLELAEAFTFLSGPPKRSIVFAFWDAEEKGLLGSKHWVAHPTFPQKQVAAMLNMDMVGRLRGDRLTVLGSRSGYGLRRLVSLQNRGPALWLDFSWKFEAGADHYPFFRRGIPALTMHTGLHDQYHTPYDDANLINSVGMGRVGRLLFCVAHELADRPHAPSFRQAAAHETEWTRKQVEARVAGPADRLGVGWQRRPSPGEGVRLTRVTFDSPAHKAGIRPGDRILQFAGREIRTGDDLRAAVMSADSPARLLLRRPGEPELKEPTVQLDGKPLRLGITWRVDPAEPGTIILTHVIAGSPAARAGLRLGDRIYQIAGQDFADDRQFAQFAKTLPEPLELLVERNGRLRTVVLHFQTEPTKRAA